jgi:phosphoglycolate phosphatase
MKGAAMTRITTACLDLAGTTVADDGVVLAAFTAAAGRQGLEPGSPDHARALEIAAQAMGQSKIDVFRRILASETAASQANRDFEQHYADSVRAGAVVPLPGAAETILALRAAGIRVCLATGFAPATRDLLLDALGWRPLIDLALSPQDVGRGRPWPDLPLTALLRLGGGAVSELLVAGDTASDVESGLRAGAGVVAGVLTGAASREELRDAGAPYILDAITGLTGLLGLGPELGGHCDSPDSPAA